MHCIWIASRFTPAILYIILACVYLANCIAKSISYHGMEAVVSFITPTVSSIVITVRLIFTGFITDSIIRVVD